MAGKLIYDLNSTDAQETFPKTWLVAMAIEARSHAGPALGSSVGTIASVIPSLWSRASAANSAAQMALGSCARLCAAMRSCAEPCAAVRSHVQLYAAMCSCGLEELSGGGAAPLLQNVTQFKSLVKKTFEAVVIVLVFDKMRMRSNAHWLEATLDASSVQAWTFFPWPALFSSASGWRLSEAADLMRPRACAAQITLGKAFRVCL